MKRKLVFYINSYMFQSLDVKLYHNTEETVLPFRGQIAFFAIAFFYHCFYNFSQLQCKNMFYYAIHIYYLLSNVLISNCAISVTHINMSCIVVPIKKDKHMSIWQIFVSNFVISASNLAKTRFFVVHFISNICGKIVLCFWPTFHPWRKKG